MTKKGGTGGLVKAGDTPFLRGLEAQRIVGPTETTDAPTFANPATPEFENRQLSLFQSFLCNTGDERDPLSNAIELWDSVPRYSISRQAMTKARINGRFLEKHEASFQHRGRSYKAVIAPARVTDHDGQQRDYYPSANEELVEHALRKLATEQQGGYFDRPNYRSGVVFSLYELRNELKKRGHSRSYQQIVEALDILSGCIIDIIPQGGGEAVGLGRAAYLPSLVVVSRSRLASDPKAKWAVQFHPLVTGSIDRLTYRQFNYKLMMSHKTQLARWLHQQLVLKYTFASLSTSFEMRYSTVRRDSGLLEGYGRQRDGVEALAEAFTELRENTDDHGNRVLASFERKNVTGLRGKLEDVVFTLWPSAEFVRDAKAGSKRLSLAADNGKTR